MNKLGFSINLKPHLRSYKNKYILDQLVTLINKHFPKYDTESIYKEYKKLDSNYSHDFVKVIDFIPYDDFFDKYTLFNSNDYIKIEPEVKRVYPYGKNGSHIIGYVGRASKVKLKIMNSQNIVGSSGKMV